MNVFYLLTIVTKMQTALTLMDHFYVPVTMDILVMELYAKVSEQCTFCSVGKAVLLNEYFQGIGM